MSRDVGSRVARAARPTSTGWGVFEATLGAVFGLIGALMCAIFSPALALLAAGGLCVLAVTSRFEIRSVAAAFVILTAFTMPMNRLYVGATGIPISDVLLVLCVGLYVLVRLAEGRTSEDQTYRPVLIALTLLAVGGLVGAIFEAPGAFFYQAINTLPRDVSGWGQNLSNLGKFLAGSLIPIALWALVRPDRAFMRRILGAFVVGTFVSALIGLLLPSAKAGNRSYGMTVHPGQFGSLSLLGISAALALLLSRPPFKAWGFIVIPILGLGIIASGSRAALGALVVLGLIIGPLTRNRAVLGGVMAGTALVLILFTAGVIKPEGQNALGRALGSDQSAENSSTIRGELGAAVWHRWTERPLTGNGFNYMRPSHNVYLGILACTGILGVVGMLSLVTSIVRRTWRRRADMMSVCVTAGYVAYLAAAYFDNIFWWRWLWFVVGMVVAVSATSPEPGEVGYEPTDDADVGVEPFASTR